MHQRFEELGPADMLQTLVHVAALSVDQGKPADDDNGRKRDGGWRQKLGKERELGWWILLQAGEGGMEMDEKISEKDWVMVGEVQN